MELMKKDDSGKKSSAPENYLGLVKCAGTT